MTKCPPFCWWHFKTQFKFHRNLFPINSIPSLVQIMAWHQWSDKPLSGQMMALKIDAYMRHSLSFNELIALDQIGWPVRNLTNCSQYHYFMSTTNADDLLTNVTIYIFVLSIWEKPNTPEYDGTITNYYIFVLGYIYIIYADMSPFVHCDRLISLKP